jgi:hypothetical protein
VSAITKLDELKKRLKKIQTGEPGVLVFARELKEIDVPGIPAADLKGRAEWLKGPLGFASEIKESSTVGDFIFTRSN